MSRRFLAGLFLSAFASISTPALANKVWVVDASGGGDFTQIQPAIDAAVDRDTVLIKAGTYSGFTIDAETLSVVGDSGATVRVNGQVTIQNISTSKFVVMGGFRVDTIDTPALLATNNAGPVRIQAARFVGYPEAARVESSLDTYFTECDMTGRDGPPADFNYHNGYPGGDALHLIGSSAALYDCTLRAGDGGWGGPFGGYCYGDGGWGGNGCNVSNGFLFASGSFLYGGAGGDGRDGDCMSCKGPGWGGNGGAGIAITTSPEGHILGCTVHGGPAGLGGCNSDCTCGGVDGSPGPAIDHPLQVQVIAGTPRRLTAPLVARGASSAASGVRLVFWGLPGDVVHLYSARQTDSSFWAPLKGVLIVPPATPARLMGQLNGWSPLTRNVYFQDFDYEASGQSRTYFLQSSHRQAFSDWTLGTGRSLVVLDPSF